jgi:hypothetical protein
MKCSQLSNKYPTFITCLPPGTGVYVTMLHGSVVCFAAANPHIPCENDSLSASLSRLDISCCGSLMAAIHS